MAGESRAGCPIAGDTDDDLIRRYAGDWLQLQRPDLVPRPDRGRQQPRWPVGHD